MSEVSLFVLNKDLKEVTDLLYDLKLVEFFEIKKEKFEKFEHEDLNELSSELLKLRSTITILKNYYESDIGNSENNAIEKTLELKEKESYLKKEILKVKDEIKRQKILKALKVTKKEIEGKDYTIGFVSSSNYKYFKNFSKKDVEYRTYRLDERVYFVAKTKKVNFAFKEFYLPEKVESGFEKKLSELEKKERLVERDLRNLANANLRHLQREELKLSKHLSSLEARTKFSKTQNVAVLSGFVPKASVKRLNRTLEDNLADKFDIEIKDAKDNAPIKLRNGFLPKKFETLLRMYSMPRYGEFDPTFLMFLIFPLFYGFILGDVGYGLLSLIVFTFAKIKLSKLKDFISILQFSSISSVIFGVIFNEYFGYELHFYHPLLHRLDDPNTLLLSAVIFGLFHINLGLIIGFFNEIKNLKKAVCDKFSWIILEFGVALVALGKYAAEATAIWVGVVFLVLSIVLIYMGHGFIGIIEVPSFFTNILSYARLMAVGLSSVAIALLVNDGTAALFSMGILGVIGGILLFLVGHIFNIVLGNFEGFLHTLRLHYVEFFTKFYSGGGREFVPFGKRDD